MVLMTLAAAASLGIKSAQCWKRRGEEREDGGTEWRRQPGQQDRQRRREDRFVSIAVKALHACHFII